MERVTLKRTSNLSTITQNCHSFNHNSDQHTKMKSCPIYFFRHRTILCEGGQCIMIIHPQAHDNL